MSHLTLAATDITADLETLASLGYEKNFIEYRLPSHQLKSGFLSKPHNVHNLAYVTSKDGISLELVSYEPYLASSVGNMLPIIAARPLAGSVEPCSEVMMEGICSIKANFVPVLAELPHFGIQACFVDDSSKTGGVLAVAIGVNDLLCAKDFWEQGLGFVPAAAGSDWSRLDFTSPVTSWRFKVLLYRDERAGGQVFLDSRGSSCLSMISSALEVDMLRILETGLVADSKGPFEILVNGRLLRMVLMLVPGRVFIELFQFISKRS